MCAQRENVDAIRPWGSFACMSSKDLYCPSRTRSEVHFPHSAEVVGVIFLRDGEVSSIFKEIAK